MQEQKIDINLSEEVAKGTYSNLTIITHSDNEFILDFVAMMPGMPKAQVVSRLLLAPEHAKRLLAALQDNIVKYESEFGKIRIPNQQPRTIAPFGNNKGEA